MSRYEQSLPPEYFEERYAADRDPWRFETSRYEGLKYDATIQALPRRRYGSAFEVGCSVGVLTERLAAICDRLVAIDVAACALDQARRRCRHLDSITFIQGQVPGSWSEGPFDLIVLSEVVYYLDSEDVKRLVRRARDTLRPDGDVVLVHWTGETHYPLTGDQAADLFSSEAADFLTVVAADRTDAYRLDVLRRRCRSSAEQEPETPGMPGSHTEIRQSQ